MRDNATEVFQRDYNRIANPFHPLIHSFVSFAQMFSITLSYEKINAFELCFISTLLSESYGTDAESMVGMVGHILNNLIE